MFRDEEGMSTSPFSVGTFSLPFVLQANSKTEIKPRREMLLPDGYFFDIHECKPMDNKSWTPGNVLSIKPVDHIYKPPMMLQKLARDWN